MMNVVLVDFKSHDMEEVVRKVILQGFKRAFK